MKKNILLNQAFQLLVKTSILFILTFILAACGKAPQDETGEDIAVATRISNNLVSKASWDENSQRLTASGEVSRNGSQVKIYDLQINGQQTLINTVEVQRNDKWEFSLEPSSIAEVPCSLYIASRGEFQTIAVSHAPADCGKAYTPASLITQSNSINLDGKISTSTSNLNIVTGDSITFSASATIEAANSVRNKTRREEKSESDENPDTANNTVNSNYSYIWDFGSYMPREQGPSTTVKFNRAGNVIVKLYVQDSEGNYDPTPDSVEINIYDAVVNSEPDGQINSPTANTTINVGESVFFSGSAVGANNQSVNYFWNFDTSGIAPSNQQTPGNQKFNIPGTYVISLSVTDSNNVTDSTPAVITVTVKSNNSPPSGEIISPNRNTVINAGDSLFFDGNASDPDGDAVTYLWDFGNSGVARSMSKTPGNITFDNPGIFSVTLMVSDTKQAVDETPDKVTITVNAVSNNPPTGTIINPIGNQVISVGDTLLFNATAIDPDGDTQLSYTWDFGAYAPRKNGQSVTMAFDRAGEITIKLLVKDSTDLFDPDPATLTVNVRTTTNANNQAPETTILTPASDITILAGEVLSFSGMAIDPENNSPITYNWNFDGAAPDNFNKDPGAITFNNPGIYIVSLSSTDSLNNTDPTPAVRVITVNPGNVINTPVKQPLDPLSQPQFVNELHVPPILQPTVQDGYETYTLTMTEFKQDLGLKDPATGSPLLTTVWGYGGTYPGPTIVARSTSDENASSPGLPTKVLWLNELPEKHILPLDPTLRCGPNAPNCQPEVRTVPHLHGGHTDADSDGHPDAWFSSGFQQVGHNFKAYMNGVYTYRNDQEAANLWYHDHAIGITRLNVYAGLAGFYLMHDTNEDRLYAQNMLPDVKFDIPLLIQDKSFYEDGSLAYALGDPVSTDPITGANNPSVVPEFYGDMILVNGKTWPKLNVEPRVYRFRVLNGSNSRFYNLRLTAGFQDVPFYVIGTDGGFLDTSVKRISSVLAPAERIDILVDFSDPRLIGKYIMLTNDANSPYPNGDPVALGTTDRVMAFHVTLPLDTTIRQSIIPVNLRTTNIPTLVATPGIAERELLLSEEVDSYGRLLPQLGTSAGGSMTWDDPITETPLLGSTEVWKIINNTGDTHPIHQHLVQFRIVERQAFDVDSYVPGDPTTLKLIGPAKAPAPDEAGWKDTVKASPGEIVRIIANYDLLGEYVWHCHILEHEDHEMMRPFVVVQ